MAPEPARAADYVAPWRGWEVGDVALHVGMLPGRLNPCVYLHRGCEIEVLAYFRGERANEKAYRFLAVVDRIVKALYVGEKAELNDGEAKP